MAYRIQGGAVGQIVKLLIALALLPQNQAYEGFLVLILTFVAHKTHRPKVILYILLNFLLL
jgi:hypothetical protein